jgi:beta-galactosidase GanA
MFSIKDGSQIWFWKNSWLGNRSLREQYPALYSIGSRKSDTIAVVMAISPPFVTFRRDLLGPRLAAYNALLLRLESIHLSEGTDEFRWNLHPNEIFSVSSLYNAIIHPNIPVDNNKKIRKMKVPFKTKVFVGIYEG